MKGARRARHGEDAPHTDTGRPHAPQGHSAPRSAATPDTVGTSTAGPVVAAAHVAAWSGTVPQHGTAPRQQRPHPRITREGNARPAESRALRAALVPQNSDHDRESRELPPPPAASQTRWGAEDTDTKGTFCLMSRSWNLRQIRESTRLTSEQGTPWSGTGVLWAP